MGMYLGDVKADANSGNLKAVVRDKMPLLDWEYNNGEFLFTLKNLNDELLSGLGQEVTIGIIRYFSKSGRRKNKTTRYRRAYSTYIGLNNSSGGIIDKVAETRKRFVFGQEPYHFEDIIDGLALNDNSRQRLCYATDKTMQALEFNWRDYGFGVFIGNELVLESPNILRMKLTNPEVSQFANGYTVINKREIDVY